MKRSALSQLILNGYLPLYDTDDGGGEGGAGNVTPPTDGKTKGAVTFKDQETFDALLAKRIEQAKRSWEADERPKIVTEVAEQVKTDIEAEATRKAAEESGEYRKLYEGLTGADGFDILPKDSSLYKLYQDLAKKASDADSAVAGLVEDEAASLSDQMKALIPEGYTAQKKLEWIRSAKKAAGETKSKPGTSHQDPNPSRTQARTVEDVMDELMGQYSYGVQRQRRQGVESNGGS